MMNFVQRTALLLFALSFALSAGAIDRDEQTAAILRAVLSDDYAWVSPGQREKRQGVSKLAEQVGVLENELYSQRTRLEELKVKKEKIGAQLHALGNEASPQRDAVSVDYEKAHVAFLEQRNRVDGLVTRTAFAEKALDAASAELDRLPSEQSPLERTAFAVPIFAAARQGWVTAPELLEALGSQFAAMTQELNVLVDPPARPYRVVAAELVLTVIAALQVAYAQDADVVRLRTTLPVSRLSKFDPFEAALYPAMMALGWQAGALLQHASLPPSSVSIIFGMAGTLRGSVANRWPLRSLEQRQARAALKLFLDRAVGEAGSPELPRRLGLQRQMRVVTDYVRSAVKRYGVAPCAELLGK